MPAERTGSSNNAIKPRDPVESALWASFREDWAARRLTIEYQPEINLMSRKIVRFEALLRWRHKTRGEIPASVFIRFAEEMGMIGDIGQWVLERACEDAMTWPPDIGVAVNVSATRLHDPDLPAIVQNALLQSGLPASRLELEITETAAIVMDFESLRILTALQALGACITIDDLDVGHSSFRYLLDFSFDKIKVDSSYTALLGQPGRRGETALAILRTIAGLCHRLNISCLAEGVETVEQLIIVMGANYTEVQGYLFSRPVTADKVQSALAEIAERWRKFALPLQRSAAAKCGATDLADMHIEPSRDAAGTITHFVDIERDVTLDKRRWDDLQFVTDRDIQTDISNRHAFLEALEVEVTACQSKGGTADASRPLCVAWIDVDHCKDAGASPGRAAEDSVLFDIASRLTENMRRIDTIGRLGGEEFAVCLPATALEAAQNVGERLRHAVSATAMETQTGPVKVTVSIGVAELAVAEDLESLMARADAAMYEAKRAGGDRVCSAV